MKHHNSGNVCERPICVKLAAPTLPALEAAAVILMRLRETSRPTLPALEAAAAILMRLRETSRPTLPVLAAAAAILMRLRETSRPTLPVLADATAVYWFRWHWGSPHVEASLLHALQLHPGSDKNITNFRYGIQVVYLHILIKISIFLLVSSFHWFHKTFIPMEGTWSPEEHFNNFEIIF
jgi:hypothetical protein